MFAWISSAKSSSARLRHRPMAPTPPQGRECVQSRQLAAASGVSRQPVAFDRSWSARRNVPCDCCPTYPTQRESIHALQGVEAPGTTSCDQQETCLRIAAVSRGRCPGRVVVQTRWCGGSADQGCLVGGQLGLVLLFGSTYDRSILPCGKDVNSRASACPSASPASLETHSADQTAARASPHGHTGTAGRRRRVRGVRSIQTHLFANLSGLAAS